MFNILTKVDKSAETRRNLHTHTHTHTHTCNLLLSPKQIGTICFAISLLISAPLFATDIPSSASTADCKHTPLQVYSGTSNLEAGWQANTIQLHWYNGDDEIQNVPSASQSCTYDGTLTPPATIPTKTGYTFKGWRARQVVAPAVQTLAQADTSIDGTISGNDVIFDYGTVSVASWFDRCDVIGAEENADIDQCTWWMGACTHCCCGISSFTLTNGTTFNNGDEYMYGISDGSAVGEGGEDYEGCAAVCAAQIATDPVWRDRLYSSFVQ